ncbi:hypothetical protein BpHYR1_019200 [Brachionus plicatilis]|uniref:Uncharacterized protein n=1 Tax=Brachionus plicatilis TaxID=10195 RepID=A0A3M7S5M1_BRAPC|nr:hypothetical protein BpHYR1_019200 [Brachionus plicatilis]
MKKKTNIYNCQIKKLRSNANFQPASFKKPKRKSSQVKQTSYEKVEKLADEICCVPQVFDFPEYEK